MPLENRQPRKFHLFQLWFAIPGVLLVVTCSYVPLSYLYKQLYWTRTEGLFIEQVINTDGDDVYTVLEFADNNGTVHQVTSSGESMFEGSDSKHFLLYYDPQNPKNFIMLNHGLYMMLLFVPFGLLLCYLAWPHREGPGETSGLV